MSRAERRAYKRMTKNQDPFAPPAGGRGRPRSERVRARRAQRHASAAEEGFVAGRFWLWGVGGAVVSGLLGFSLAWPSMPLAAWIGLLAAAGWAGLAVGLRYLQRRLARSA